jgi:hypothetical protein
VNANVVTVTMPAAFANGLWRASITAPSITDFAGHSLLVAASHAFAFVAAGQTLLIPQAHAAYKINQLALGAGSNIDLKDNDLLIDYAATADSPIGSRTGSTYGGVTGLIQSGSNGGAWNGTGLVTSMSAAASGVTTLGVAEAADALGLAPGQTQLCDGVTVDATTVIVKYTYAGDANLDGIVSGDDYSAIDFNVAVAGSFGWYNGDFNYDGIISGDDYSSIDFAILAQGAPL